MSQPHAQAGLRAGLAQGARGRRPGHNHVQKFRVWTSGQMRRVTAPVRREMRRRAVVEPVIGHIKAEHRMGRSYLKGRDGARINAVLAAAGCNFCSCAGSSGFGVLSSERCSSFVVAPTSLALPASLPGTARRSAAMRLV